jgi:predicted transcriptional regulator
MRTELVTTLKEAAATDDDTHRRLAILQGIARGERAVEEGRVVSHAQARKRMARWLS